MCSSFDICFVCLCWNRYISLLLAQRCFWTMSVPVLLWFCTFRWLICLPGSVSWYVCFVFFNLCLKKIFLYYDYFALEIAVVLPCVWVWLWPAGGGLWRAKATRPLSAVSECMASLARVPGSVEAQSIDFRPPLTFPRVCLSFQHNSLQTNASNWKHIFSLTRRTHMCRYWHTWTLI